MGDKILKYDKIFFDTARKEMVHKQKLYNRDISLGTQV